MSSPDNNSNPNTASTSRHRTDDDLERLASDLLDPDALLTGVAPPFEEDVDEDAPLEMDYGSDDEEDGAAHLDVRGTELSRRTGMLMNSFRDYVNTMEEGGEEGAGEGRALGRTDGKTSRALNSVDEENAVDPGSNGAPSLNEGSIGNKAKGLLRDFVLDAGVAIGEEGDDYDDYYHENGAPRNILERRYRYSKVWMRSKRVKRAVAMVVLACAAIGIVSVVSKTKKERGLPDWNEQLAEDMEEERGKPEIGDHGIVAKPGQPLQKPADDAAVQHALSPKGLLIAKTYDPMWYTRHDGYSGTTYEESLTFCARQGTRTPCPYEAYCPDGPNTPPYGGEYKEGPRGSWSPIIDAKDGWVHVSSGLASPGCSRIDRTPDWGEAWGEGAQEEQTRHVMCCQLGNAAVTKEVSGKKPSLVDENVIAEEYADAESYLPTWFDRSNGWNGRTYDEAIDFCHAEMDALNDSRGTLCPYHVVCPTGPRHIPYGGLVDEPQGSWVPTSDASNSWVQIGGVPVDGTVEASVLNSNLCVTHMNAYLQEPAWGLTGENNEEITRHILCCRAHATASAALGQLQHEKAKEKIELMADTEEAIEKVNDVVARIFSPMLYDRDRGWKGSTYDEAVHFCSAKTRVLCPVEV